MPKGSLSAKIHTFAKLAIDILTEGQILQRAILQQTCVKVFASASVSFLDIGPQMEQLGNIFGSDYGKWVSKPSG